MSRSRILQGAAEILDEGVYGDLTVDALARALHMSKSTLYKYFASKDDVVISLIDNACADTERALDAVDHEKGDVTVALDRLTDVLAGHADRIPRAIVLQHTRLPGPCQDRLSLTRASLGQRLQRVLDRGVESGKLTFRNSVLASTTLLAGADAAMKASARGELDEGRGAAVRSVLQLLKPGLFGALRAA
ncbi:MAG: TetR/AcrR family transcriptional regulator [Alphaproteobacteria bacterium]|nr:TetR/AcrR family transcriptional regulator [Alphaproteobacteria bacterium]